MPIIWRRWQFAHGHAGFGRNRLPVGLGIVNLVTPPHAVVMGGLASLQVPLCPLSEVGRAAVADLTLLNSQVLSIRAMM